MIVVDKPAGLTSHDVVAAARRSVGERQIGHMGTLDPLATGVLPLAVGHATRLIRFLAGAEKEYDATIRFGFATDSYDIAGAETRRTNAVPSRQHLVAALSELTGDYLQQPPAYSAKHIRGRRAYQLARDRQVVELTPISVRVSRAELLEFTEERAQVALTCTAGFYVRSFAHSLGELVATGACLEGLRRTRSGDFGLGMAIPLDALCHRARWRASLVPLEALLGRLPAVTLTGQGRAHVAHGRDVDENEYRPAPQPVSGSDASVTSWVRLMDACGCLVGVATSGARPGSLHPSVVLI